MTFVDTPQGMRFYQFQSLQGLGVRQAVFTRHGGVSPEPWRSLNLGGTVGDPREHVVENRQRCFSAFGRPVESLFDVWQVHSADVICADAPRPLDTPHQKADIILTDRPGLTLMMRFADCVPIFLVDPVRKVIGMAHAGWVGTVKKVAKVAVESMATRYGCLPGDIRAGIGPSISVGRYPVGEDVVQEIRATFGDAAGDLLPQQNGQPHFDLWAANRLTLEQCGVPHVELAGICTATGVDDWFSHRAEQGKTGRFGAMLSLEG